MKKRTSIHDIAKHLNVSATTVSFVLNGKAEEKRISGEVAKKVQQYIDLIGYRPNFIAKSLRTGKSHIIGMMVEDISDPFFSAIARVVEHRAYERGYKIFFASTENDVLKARDLLRVFKERQVDAYIIAPPPDFENELQALLEDDMPVVLFDRHFGTLRTNNVVVDNYEGSLQGVMHLQEEGYQNIGFVTLESNQTQMEGRLKAYLDALKKSGRKKYILRVPYLHDQKKITEKIKGFLVKYPTLNAVFFSTNYLTLNGLSAINELGMKIPEDLAIVSFDDSPVFKLFSPTITAVAQPIDKIAEAVVNKILFCLKGPADRTSTETIILSTDFIKRNSSTQKK